MDGYNIINPLKIHNMPGEINVKNLSYVYGLTCSNLKCVNFENIYNMSLNTTGGFSSIEDLKIKNISLDNNNRFNFSSIKNLIIEDATIEGRRDKMFSRISNAIFNNVKFSLYSMNTQFVIFNNTTAGFDKIFNNFEFNNCSFVSDGAYFGGINGKFNNCSFKKLYFQKVNDLTFNMDNMDSLGPGNYITFHMLSSFNNINIINNKKFHYVFSANAGENVINFENKLAVDNNSTYNILIDERIIETANNIYKFINDKYYKMLIAYGNTEATGSTNNRHPTIYLANKIIVLNLIVLLLN